jgi:predicted phage gp36 major capsid-like protein
MQLADNFAQEFEAAPVDDFSEVTKARAALSAAMKEVLAERDKWKRSYDLLKVEYDDLYDQNEKVLAERDVLAKDAAKYNALKNAGYMTPDEFDKQVSEAMKGQP